MRLAIGMAELPLAILLLLQIFAHHKVLAEGQDCNKAGVLSNEPGVCLNIESCNTYLQNHGQQAAAEMSFRHENVCAYAGNVTVVCCPIPPIIIPTTPSYDLQNQNSTFRPLYAPDCGFSSITTFRTVGLFPADLGNWPWIAVLGYRNKKQRNKPKWRCGGSLISKQHVLTAAHCVYEHDDLYLARLGDHDLIDGNKDGANPIDVPIQRAVHHPAYNNVSLTNDIAVLRLCHTVTITPAIHPICLPLVPEVKDRNYVANFPFMAGWGSLDFPGLKSSILHQLQLPVASEKACAKAFAPFPNRVIDKRVMCAGYTLGPVDVCQSGGGSLMFPKGDIWYVIGVVSYGFRCAEAGIPGVYTRVTHFLDFIMENLK